MLPWDPYDALMPLWGLTHVSPVLLVLPWDPYDALMPLWGLTHVSPVLLSSALGAGLVAVY